MTAVDDFLGDVPTWHTLAACKGMDPGLFFPDRGAPQNEAKAICERCPVRMDCLDHALTHGEHHGIWGGTSEKKRRSISRKSQRPRRRTNWGYANLATSPGKNPLPQTEPMAPETAERMVDILEHLERRFS